MQVLEKLNIKLTQKEKVNKYNVVILKVPYSNNAFGGEILGRTLVDWVAFACQGLPIKIEDYDNKSNILNLVKNIINNNYDYTIILLSSTPLLNGEIINNIIEYCNIKNVNICKLPIGYVVKNSYVIQNEQLTVDSFYSQNIEDFYIVENKKQFNYAMEVLQDRINTFHINNGVDIKTPKHVYIEPEVDIGHGVVIYPNNSLKKSTTIGNNVILKENNTITSSKIGQNSCISGSVINGSIISENVYVSAFCEINNSFVDHDSIINSGCKINDYSIEANAKLKSNTVIGEEDDCDNRSGQSR